MLFNHSTIIVWNNYWLFVQGQLKQRQTMLERDIARSIFVDRAFQSYSFG